MPGNEYNGKRVPLAIERLLELEAVQSRQTHIQDEARVRHRVAFREEGLGRRECSGRHAGRADETYQGLSNVLIVVDDEGRATGVGPFRGSRRRRADAAGAPRVYRHIVANLDDEHLGADPRVRKVRVYFVDESGAMLLADSSGQIVENLQPMTTMGLTCIAEQDGKREENSYNAAARDEGFCREVAERLKQLKAGDK